jgi:hypothetical protein
MFFFSGDTKKSSFYPDSDLNPVDFLSTLASKAGEYAFLSPTQTGLNKSIMDATGGVRYFLKGEGIHDYSLQQQGPDAKALVDAYFVKTDGLIKTVASLYRPVTKHGDPRIWFKGLGNYASPRNLLVLVAIHQAIYVINLSDPEIRNSLENDGYVSKILFESRSAREDVKKELLDLIEEIHNKGWLPSITPGDPGVGDTLENALGIHRNNSKNPDYKGIELKSSRLSRHGKERSETRATLFTRVPNGGLSYREIVEKYGKIQIPRGATEARLQLYETFKANHVNAYNLYLNCNEPDERVEMEFAPSGQLGESDSVYVSSWGYEELRDALKQKHPETFWVSAESKDIGGKEYFRYDKILYTHKPNSVIFPSLIADGKVSLDLAAHVDYTTNKWRDHGMLWKIWKKDLPLLISDPESFDLSKI